MLWRALLAIAFVGMASVSDAEPVGVCPPVNGEYVDFLTHATDCTKFYKCDWGNPVEFTCPDNLHFNPTLNVCDWPRDAGCEGAPGPGPGPTTTTTKPPSSGSCDSNRCPANNSNDYGVYFPHEDCSKYCQCDWGVAHERECPAGLHFNPILNVCDWPRDAGCEDFPGPDPGPTTTTTSKPPPSGSCDSSKCPANNSDEYGVYFPHEDCGKYCQCDWGVAHERECPAGLHFNPILNVCDWPRDAGCEDFPGPDPGPTTTTTTKPPPSGSCDSSKCPANNSDEYGVYFPHEDCGKYCQCDWGVAHERECPAGLHFNPILNVCDWPRDAGCEDFPGPGPGPTTTTTTKPPPSGSCDSSKCPADNSDEYGVYFPHEDCGKYCQCDWGVAHERECPAGLHFNPILNVCDWPKDAGCEGSDGTTTTTKPPPSGSCDLVKCPAVNGDYPIYFPHEDCGKFCQCDWGVAHERECPAGLHFNPTLNVCDFPENAGCKGSDGLTTTTKAPPSGSCDSNRCPANNSNDYGVYFPHEDCGKYCQCDWGVAHERECPAGLHFNPILNVCDWPRDAGCEDFPGPGPGPTTTTTTKPPPSGSCDSSKCPANNSDDYGVYFPHEDCGKYCQCDWGVAHERECPAGLHFNPILNVCDWPRDAGCEDFPDPGPGPTTTTTTKPPPSGSCDSSKCPANNSDDYGVYFPHEDCGKYCQCDWGVAHERECPAGLHFNPILNVCDWPRDAGCEDFPDPGPGPTTTTTTKPPPSGSCDSSKCPANNSDDYGVYFPHEDCGKYCQCDWGVAHERECPAGLHFNPILNVCDWPRDAGCEDFPGPGPGPTTTTTTKPPPSGSCDSSKCPANNSDDYGVYFPHEDCGKYCQCDWGVAHERECPAGLHFNPILNVCDWPRDAGCEDFPGPGPGPTTTTTTKPPPSGSCDSSKCPANNSDDYGVYFPHEDCGKYCQCDWGVAHERECPAGLHFNPILNVCDWPKDAGCEDFPGPGPGPTTTTTTKPPPSGSCDSSKCPANNSDDYGVYFPHEDCGKYCQCDWGVAHERECPAGLHFNPILNVCDWPRDAGCEDFPDPGPGPTTTTTTKPPPSGSCDSSKCPANNSDDYGVYFPHEDCGKYCQCDWGVAHERECPAGLHFNPILNVCDWPRDAGCEDFPGPGPGPTTTTTTKPPPSGSCDSSKCPANNSDDYGVYFPHEDCGKYCQCDWGVAHERECPAGLHFNPILNVCDWPKDAGCEDFPGPGPGPTTTTTTKPPPSGSCDSSKCPANNSDDYGVYFPHEDCGKYCQCDWGVAHERECPAGLHFNPILNVCDWPRDAGCEDFPGPGPGPTTTTTTKPPPSGSCDSSKCPANNSDDYGVYFPHEDCGKYCQCDWGVAHERECPAGLHFNPILNVCDWPRDAGCEDFPDPGPGPTTTTTTTKPPPSGSCDSSKCPANNSDDYGVYFPHEDCGKYCQCDWGVAHERECPAGLHFNPILNVCDWPRDAGCAA